MTTFKRRPYGAMMEQHMLDVPRSALWAGMGLGKTVSTLNVIDLLEIVDPGPTLVCAPLRVAQSTWPDEAAKWTHLHNVEVTPIIGTPAQRVAALRRVFGDSASVFTINYENLPWLDQALADMKKPWPFRRVVLDEATKVKGWRGSKQISTTGKEFVRAGGSQRPRALAKVAFNRVDRLIELTGTPSPNGLVDLWGPAWFIDQGARLGRTFDAFSHRWFRPSYDGYGIEPLPHSEDEIHARLRDVCLSIEARDWFDLREPIKNVVRVRMPAKARALYTEMEKKMFAEIDGHEVEAFSAAARTMKCLQLANGAAYVDERAEQWVEVHDGKLQALESIIEESGGMPIVVAYHFRSDLARLQRSFPKGRHLDKEPQTIRDWNAGKIPLLFAHPASAGHGLNLQDGGNVLVFFSVNWNLEEHMQIIERIGPTRQMQAGHDRPVFLHYLLAEDTVDELVLQRLETKREVQDILMEAMRRI